MWGLKACVACLSTNTRMYEIGDGELRNVFNSVSGLKTMKCENLPNFICYVCLAYVRRFQIFRQKCQTSYFTLQQIIKSTSVLNEATNCVKLLDHKLLGIGLPFARSDVLLEYWDNTDPGNSLVKFVKEVKKTENKETVTKKDFVKCEKDVEATVIESDGDYDTFEDTSGNLDEFLIRRDVTVKNDEDNLDSVALDEEYAKAVQLTMNEAKAVFEVQKLTRTGSYPCDLCSMSFFSKSRLDHHARMHDKHVSGVFICEICNFCYKTEYMLGTHMNDKHMYKYLCKKCDEVNYTKVQAKQHFVWTHLSQERFGSKWKDARPKWMATRGGARIKGISYKSVNRPSKATPEGRLATNLLEFLTYATVPQEQQYLNVLERRNSKNYLEALYKCELCYKGFRAKMTYDKHLRKHNPEISGTLQCDMCKCYTRSARQMYMHMTTSHVFKYSCKVCAFTSNSRNQAVLHYKWHKNVTYNCPHCEKKFRKVSTCLTHVRLKHPSTVVCQICGQSFVSDAGLYCHKRIAHTKEELQSYEGVSIDTESVAYCNDCQIQFIDISAYNTHLETSSKHSTVNRIYNNTNSDRPRKKCVKRPGAGRPGSSSVINNGVPTATTCDVCDQVLPNDVQARKHYETEHPGHEFLKRYMCDVCGHVTKQYANLVAHMRTHTQEKPFECPHCDRKFSLPSNRDRHLVVHTGERRFHCHHCNRRFTQSSAVKLHIQTVHMKIPYAPWNKAHRKRKAKQAAARIAEANKPQTFYEMPSEVCMPQHKIVIDNTQGDYLNAYITYNED